MTDPGEPTRAYETFTEVAPPPDRRPWMVAGLLALILAVVLAVVLLGGDDDDDDTATDASVTTTSASTTSATATAGPTTDAAPTTTDAPAAEAPPVTLDPDACTAAGANPATPGLTAETVFDAWVLGDRTCAARLMEDDALAELFDRDGEGAADTFQGCTEVDEPDPHADCAFTYEGGTTHYLLRLSPTEGWKVFDVTQSAD
ncbi:MAG: hypothetical protein Q8K58_07400 [Acidimicrobiales bacterium]|nr:hypothetical protein [Acidimicrobiales bacterium]